MQLFSKSFYLPVSNKQLALWKQVLPHAIFILLMFQSIIALSFSKFFIFFHVSKIFTSFQAMLS